MKLVPDSEKHTLDSIAILSGQSPETVRDIFLCLLFAMTAEAYKGSNHNHVSIPIPLFGDIVINYEKIPASDGAGYDLVDQTFIKLNPLVKSVLLDIVEGRDTVISKHLKGDVKRYMSGVLGEKDVKSFSLV